MAWFQIEGMRLYKPFSEGATILAETESEAIDEFRKVFPHAEISRTKIMKGQCGQICHLDDSGKLITEPPLTIDVATCNVELRNDGLRYGKLFFILPITL